MSSGVSQDLPTSMFRLVKRLSIQFLSLCFSCSIVLIDAIQTAVISPRNQSFKLKGKKNLDVKEFISDSKKKSFQCGVCLLHSSRGVDL